MKISIQTKGNATRLFIDENDGSSLGYVESISTPRDESNYYEHHRVLKGDTMEETVTTTITLETFKRVWENAKNPMNLHPLILDGILSIMPDKSAWRCDVKKFMEG